MKKNKKEVVVHLSVKKLLIIQVEVRFIETAFKLISSSLDQISILINQHHTLGWLKYSEQIQAGWLSF